jgi:hypothetical protein
VSETVITGSGAHSVAAGVLARLVDRSPPAVAQVKNENSHVTSLICLHDVAGTALFSSSFFQINCTLTFDLRLGLPSGGLLHFGPIGPSQGVLLHQIKNRSDDTDV